MGDEYAEAIEASAHYRAMADGIRSLASSAGSAEARSQLAALATEYALLARFAESESRARGPHRRARPGGSRRNRGYWINWGASSKRKNPVRNPAKNLPP